MSAPEGGWGMFGLDAAGSIGKSAYAYNTARGRQVADQVNARFAALEAEDTRATGNRKAARVEASAERNVGTVKATVAGRGFTSTYGTANAVADATDYASRIDALTVREQTANKVSAGTAQAGLFSAQADSESPGNEAFGTLIGQAGLLAKRWKHA